MPRSFPLQRFAFGRLCQDRTFSAEIVHRDDGWDVSCDIENRHVLLRRLGFDLICGLEHEWEVRVQYPCHHIVALATNPRSAETPLVFLEAHSPPFFETISLNMEEVFSSSPFRITSIDVGARGKDMPPVTRYTCLTFRTRRDHQGFLEDCKRLSLPHPIETDVPVLGKNLYSQENMRRLCHLYQGLCIGLAFEAERSIASGILEPLELLVSLKEYLLQLQGQSESDAVLIFRYFLNNIPIPTFSRRSRNRRRRNRSSRTSDAPSVCDLLRNAASQYYTRREGTRNLFSPSRAAVESYHLIVTPLSRHFEGPLPDRGNAVLRRFGHHERFLRVCFSDESRSRLQHRAGLNASQGVGTRLLSMMVNGFQLAGRNWEFLGYSMSGLREHSVWFVNPFESDQDPHVLMNATRIRSLLGDFTRIERKPARLAARWSQAFTSTDPSVTLEASTIRHIPDKLNGSSNFTDGCGSISPALAHEVWLRLQSSKRKTSRGKTPSCFQFRLGGAKGVVVQDANLTGRVICLRPSQVKFEAPESRTFDIAATSSRPSPMFLNRPLIVLLEYLGVEPAQIIALQQQAVNQVKTDGSSLLTAPALLQQYGLGASFRLPSLFSHIVRFLDLDVDTHHGGENLKHELIEDCLSSAAGYVLRELKYRARIPVPGSYTLLGVSDESNCLEEGQIYACIQDEQNGINERVLGRVLITRPPQIHPGDVQFVEAVDHPKLHHLTNVVVFSCKGNRSLPSCLGGGDLDGDVYNLIVDRNLFPRRTNPPGDYKSLPDKLLPRRCKMQDIAEFVLDYMRSDLIGHISILHLRIADLKTPGCTDCLKLARLASQAVDFPKTGTPVIFRDLPRQPGRRRPDFLCPEGGNPDPETFYISPKVLGQLFRNIQLETNRRFDEGRTAPVTHGHEISRAVRTIQMEDFGLPSLQDPSNDLREEMRYILHHYKERLWVIARSHTQSQNPDHYLTEAELVSGTIEATWVDHRGRQEAATAMNFQTHELVTAVRRKLRTSQEEGEDEEEEGDDDETDYSRSFRAAETMSRSWAAWLVAEAELEENPESFGPQSFGLIALGSLLKIVKEAADDSGAHA